MKKPIKKARKESMQCSDSHDYAGPTTHAKEDKNTKHLCLCLPQPCKRDHKKEVNETFCSALTTLKRSRCGEKVPCKTHGKCKECGHSQSLHTPYHDGTGWHCTKYGCSRWNFCVLNKSQGTEEELEKKLQSETTFLSACSTKAHNFWRDRNPDQCLNCGKNEKELEREFILAFAKQFAASQVERVKLEPRKWISKNAEYGESVVLKDLESLKSQILKELL